MKNLEAIKNKQERNRQKNAAKERLTNQYMINLTWGFVGVIVLQLLGNVYNGWGITNANAMDWTMRIIGIVFALGGGALCYFWFRSDKERSRFMNYAIFSWVIAGIALFLSFFRQIRMLLVDWGILSVFWVQVPQRFIWAFMAGIALWLIVALVIYIVKYRKI